MNLVERISRPGPTGLFVELISEFIDSKHPDEPIHPKLHTEWITKYHKFARRYMPDAEIKRMDAILSDVAKIDSSVWDIDFKSNSKVTFLLGAGASAPSGIPTVSNLLTSLWDKAKKLNREDVDKLAKFCDEHGIKNIEDLLTAAYLSNFAARKNSVISLLDYFLFSQKNEDDSDYLPPSFSKSSDVNASSISFLQETLQILFSLLTSTMITANPNPVHDAIVDFVCTHKNSSIITTNYDCCIDEALSKKNIPFSRLIDSNHKPNPRGSVELIKMHGSINWAYCDSCQYTREFDFPAMKKAYSDDTLSFPVIGICTNCTGQRRPLLVPPLSFKFMMFPSLIELWNSARQSIEKAEYLVVIGYSFSDADNYITKIVSRSMSMYPNQKIIIVTKDTKLVQSLRNKFSVSIENFSPDRIIEVCESCDKIIPSILDKSKRQKDPPTTQITQQVGNDLKKVISQYRGSDTIKKES